MLEAFGWDVRDPDVVHREFKTTSQDKPVDYALCLVREPRLLVEAKGLGETLSDHKWMAQVLSYATVAGVEWCVLTDGNEYCFYNATARVPAQEKLFYTVKLTECSEDEAIHKLGCLAPEYLEKNLLDELWNSHFVDRRVRAALLRLTGSPDKGLMRLLRKCAPRLTPRQIAQSLRRLTVRIEMPIIAPPGLPQPQPGQAGAREVVGPKARATRRKTISVSLVDLIAVRLLQPPLRLFREYKGTLLEATLQVDGKVTFQDGVYDSCSSAAEMARKTVTGRRMNTNGWAFWQYEGEDRKKQTLDQVRQRFQETKGKV
jgi:hypothetical protein